MMNCRVIIRSDETIYGFCFGSSSETIFVKVVECDNNTVVTDTDKFNSISFTDLSIEDQEELLNLVNFHHNSYIDYSKFE